MKKISYIVNDIPMQVKCPICNAVAEVDETDSTEDELVIVLDGCDHAFLNINLDSNLVIEFRDTTKLVFKPTQEEINNQINMIVLPDDINKTIEVQYILMDGVFTYSMTIYGVLYNDSGSSKKVQIDVDLSPYLHDEELQEDVYPTLVEVEKFTVEDLLTIPWTNYSIKEVDWDANELESLLMQD
jgi:hypothetical protein